MTRFLSIALLTLYTVAAQADIYSANNALSRGDYETAVKEFTKLAEKGDANAQANLGYMYYAGEGVPQNFEQAVFWYRKAATQGNRDAQYNLAVSYAFGEGVKQDLTEAAIWYRRAGEQGHVVSQYSLGISYAYGEGVPQDQKEAARWFLKAAEQGYARAQVHLGSMYHTGEGVEQDYTQAVRWYRLAADRGDATAQYNLGAMYRSGKGVEQNYAQAKRWFRQSSDQGYAAATNELASLERSAAANVATRTIQAKPELQTVAEKIPEPSPTQKEVIEEQQIEEVIAKTEQPLQQQTEEIEEAKKEPLFSVEKEGLLSLDESELDIVTPEVSPNIVEESKPEQEIVEKTAAETEIETAVDTTETTNEITQADETTPSPIHNALGLPAPEETTITKEESETSEGFFSKLFSKKESDVDEVVSEEPDTPAEEIVANVIEEETIVEVETESDAIDETANEITQTNETSPSPIHNALGLPAPEETTITKEESETSEGFFSKLFSKKESDVDEVVSEEPDTPAEEIVANIIEEEPVEEFTPVPESVKETKFVALEAENNDEGIEKSSEESTLEETESSGGFFSRLFGNKDGDKSVAEEIEKPEEEIVADVVEESKFEQETVEETVVEAQFKTTNEITQTDEIRHTPIHNAFGIPASEEANIATEEKEPSEGFFNRLFSGKEKSESLDTNSEEVEESEEENIADVIEEDPVEEVIPESIEEKTELAAIEKDKEEINVAENNWAETNQENEIANEDGLSQSSGGFFSAIGDFFSGDKKETETNELDSSNEEDVLIAKAEEPATALEEIELAETAETDISKYSVNAGRHALTNDDYDEAYSNFQPLADAGDDEAQAHLGSLYYVGKGVNKDLEQAFNWYKKAADQGNVDAQYSLGNMYLLGEGIEQSNTNAAEWYRMASDQGHSVAKNNLENLQKLEALNRENQLKLDALAAEQKAEEETAKSEELNNTPEISEDIAALDTNTIEETETEVIEDEKPGFFSRLFGGNSEEEQTNELNSEAEEKNNVVENEVALSDDVYTSIDEVSEAEATIDKPETVEFASNEESELITDIETSEPVIEENEKPGFFSRLFGSKTEEEQTNELNSEVEEGIDVVENETVLYHDATSIDEVSDAKPTIQAQETIELASNEESELITDIETSEPVIEEEEKSPGFFSRLFGSSDEKDDVTEDIALADIETNNVKTEIETIASEELTKEVSTLSEVDRIRPLATQGDADAQYQLGTLYYSGNGIEQDYSQAALWYRRAAQQGNVDAQYSLGNMYLMGEGVGQNDRQAAEWYTMAAEQGHSSARHNLSSLQTTETIVTQEVETETTNTPQLISLDEQPQPSTPTDDSAKAIYEQALAYAFGDGVPQNDRTAFNLYFEAAEKGYVLAQYKLGVAFAYGEGVRQDDKQAAEWYRKAAEQGYTIAQRNLATMYLNGKGVEQDKVYALAWYEVVANAGNAMDMHRRDRLKSELSEVELNESLQLAKQISSRITNPSL